MNPFAVLLARGARLRCSDHAKSRMKQRTIGRHSVIEAVRMGRPPKKRPIGLAKPVLLTHEQLNVVVALNLATMEIVVLTTYWTDDVSSMEGPYGMVVP